MIALRHDQRGRSGVSRSLAFSSPSHTAPPQPLRHRAGPPRPPRSPHARHHRAPPPHGTSAIAGELLRTRCSDTNCWNRGPLATSPRNRMEVEEEEWTQDFPAGARTPPRAHERPNPFLPYSDYMATHGSTSSIHQEAFYTRLHTHHPATTPATNSTHARTSLANKLTKPATCTASISMMHACTNQLTC